MTGQGDDMPRRAGVARRAIARLIDALYMLGLVAVGFVMTAGFLLVLQEDFLLDDGGGEVFVMLFALLWVPLAWKVMRRHEVVSHGSARADSRRASDGHLRGPLPLRCLGRAAPMRPVRTAAAGPGTRTWVHQQEPEPVDGRRAECHSPVTSLTIRVEKEAPVRHRARRRSGTGSCLGSWT